MTVAIRDSDGTVRLSGDLLASGGATGDVLTRQADGTYAPAAGGGATPTLAQVVAEGNTAAGSIIVDGDNEEYLQGIGDPGEADGPAASVLLGSQAGNNGGAVSIAAGSAQASGASPGTATVAGGNGFGASGSRLVLGAGGDTDPGVATLRTAGSFGTSGKALVSDGGNGLVYGGVRVAAAVPVAAPSGNLPFAYDTTAVTGGFYFWNGAAWVKIATIL